LGASEPTMTDSVMTQTADSTSQGSQAAASRSKRLAGRRVAMVTFSSYPFDPRPRRSIDALIAEGATVDLICLGSKNEVKGQAPHGVKVFRVPLKHPRRGKFEYAFRYGVFILISSLMFAVRSLGRRYDLVYVHNMPDILVASALIPKMFGSKVVLDLHDPMPELMMTIFRTPEDNRSVRIMKRLEKWSIARADLAVTVNVACKRIFSSRSCPAEKIAVVMNAPDGQIFPRREPKLRSLAAQHGDRRFVIMYHGSIVERNGLDVAVDALARVRHTIPSAELRIFGSQTAFLDHVMEKARSMGLQDAVQYLGPRRLEELVTEIDNCDLGIIPNHRNAFTDINTPTRVFEYLAMGKPVIAPSTQGILDYFDKNSLVFFEPGNAAELAQQIEFAFSQPSEVLEIVRRGQEIFSEHTWDREKDTLVTRVSSLFN
jgi:glycosyltransferase involved in cell wall biosynthesis